MKTLTATQAEKFTEGFNKHVESWNNDVNDFGRSPYRSNTWADMGYSAARSKILARQFDGELNIKLTPITVSQASATYSVWMGY